MTRRIATALVLTALLSVPAWAAAPEATNLTPAFRDAGTTVDRLEVYEIAGIVIIRGRAVSQADAERLSHHARGLGYDRVANLVQIVRHDDDAIARAAEMELSRHRSLDGCRFSVQSNGGVLRVAGFVQHELQKDVAVQVLRSIDGVQSIETQLKKFLALLTPYTSSRARSPAFLCSGESADQRTVRTANRTRVPPSTPSGSRMVCATITLR